MRDSCATLSCPRAAASSTRSLAQPCGLTGWGGGKEGVSLFLDRVSKTQQSQLSKDGYYYKGSQLGKVRGSNLHQ